MTRPRSFQGSHRNLSAMPQGRPPFFKRWFRASLQCVGENPMMAARLGGARRVRHLTPGVFENPRRRPGLQRPFWKSLRTTKRYLETTASQRASASRFAPAGRRGSNRRSQPTQTTHSTAPRPEADAPKHIAFLPRQGMGLPRFAQRRMNRKHESAFDMRREVAAGVSAAEDVGAGTVTGFRSIAWLGSTRHRTRVRCHFHPDCRGERRRSWRWRIGV